MAGDTIDAVFENGVFRPLAPVNLQEHQRVTLQLPSEEAAVAGEALYEPLPLQQCRTVRVRVKHVGEIGPLPYPIPPDELEQ